MATRFTIEIHDEERDVFPSVPWTAVVYGGPDDELLAAGCGYTYRDALADIDWGEVGHNEERAKTAP